MKTDQFQLTSTTKELDGKRVLLVGFRQQLVEVLERLQIPYAVWHDRPVKRNLNCLKLIDQPFPKTAISIRQIVDREFSDLGPFTDVIAGTEASVYSASVCRRALGARKSKDSIALRCSDKQQMKSLMKGHGIPMTDYVAACDIKSFDDVFERLGPKVVIKQRRNSGGRGLSFAFSVEELAQRKEKGLIYEKYVEANELSIESYIHEGEIRFSSETNYLVKTHANIVPANVPAAVLKEAQALNRLVVAALNLQWGLTHAEFYWNDREILFGEVALRPPGGYIMECISLAHGFDAWEGFLANEIDLPYTFPSACKRTSGVAMLHAGKGKIKSIEREREARQLPTCVRLSLLVKPGDQVEARSGVGEISAYGLFVSDSESDTVADVLRCLEILKFEHEPVV